MSAVRCFLGEIGRLSTSPEFRSFQPFDAVLVCENFRFSAKGAAACIGIQQIQDEVYQFVGEIRLDNRKFIAGKLGFEINHFTDAELVFALYRKYGDKTPSMLQGDWWFCVYDHRDNSIFLVQDPSSYHAIYYYCDEHYLLFSSSINVLLGDNRVKSSILLDKVLDRALIIGGVAEDSTFYQNIKALNPAHWMKITPRTFERQRYWFPEQMVIDHSITVEQAACELFQLFEQAVSYRTNNGPVASMLSGGLDSGSVVSVAAPILAARQQTLHTFSHVPRYDVSDIPLGGRTGNEQPFMEAIVAEHSNISPHYVNSAAISPLQGIRMLTQILSQPIHGAINAYWLVELPQLAASKGFSTLLTGEMGNATISFSGALQALSLRQNFNKFGVKGVAKKLLRPSYHKFKAWNVRKQLQSWKNYSYVSDEVFSACKLEQRILASGRSIDFSSHVTSHREMMLKILKPGSNPRYQGGSNLSNYFGIHFSDPTSDIRVIEYLLKLPHDCFIGPNGELKYLIKKMMDKNMPHTVLHQHSKGLQSADLVKRIQQDLPEIKTLVQDFSSDLLGVTLFDKRRLLRDIEELKEYRLSTVMASHFVRTVGIMDFLNSR